MMEASTSHDDTGAVPAHPSTSTATRIIIGHNPPLTAAHIDDADLARPASRQSNHSAVSSVTFPQLKRKQKRDKINATRMTTVVVQNLDPAPPETSTCVPTEALDHVDVISNPPQNEPRITFLARSNTAPSPKRKPPASHSSYGVETITGPPPSFTTQRTLSQERIWKLDRSKSLRMTLDRSSEREAASTVTASTREASNSRVLPGVTVDSSPETADTQSIPTPTDGEQLDSMESRGEQGLGVSNTDADNKSSSGSQKSEDLFLNIARTDAVRPTSSKGEKRRSRISLPFFSSNRQATAATGHRLSPNTPTLELSQHSTRTETEPYFSSKRSSLGQHTQRTFTRLQQDHDSNKETEQSSGPESSAESAYDKQGHRSSTFHYDSNRSTLRASAHPRSSRIASETAYVDRAKIGDNNATESTISTAAPSTVWDELDDLKSRIRKLELTGKLPPCSAAAMSNAERPRTATTAATTMSGSPKQNKPPTTTQSTVESVAPHLHPLLHEALGNANSVLSSDVYQKLHSTAQDALQLVSMMSFDTQSTRSGVPAVSERQIRRRTESMCRSLTELVIAMIAEQKQTQPVTRPASRETHTTPNATFRTRRHSQNADMLNRPPVTTRVQSRLESRRTSAQLPLNHNMRTSPDQDSPVVLPQLSTSGTRTTRVPSNLRTRRIQGYLDGTNDAENSSPSIRPVSRAMTDIAARRSSRDYAQFSREYTNHHPLPTQNVPNDTSSSTRTPLPSHLSTNFTSRRKYVSSINAADTAEPTSSPLAAREPWGHITVVTHGNNNYPSDTASEAPGSARSITNKRSFGFSNRISSVSSRLRAAKNDRAEARTSRDIVPQTGTVLDDRLREQQEQRHMQ